MKVKKGVILKVKKDSTFNVQKISALKEYLHKKFLNQEKFTRL